MFHKSVKDTVPSHIFCQIVMIRHADLSKQLILSPQWASLNVHSQVCAKIVLYALLIPFKNYSIHVFDYLGNMFQYI